MAQKRMIDKKISVSEQVANLSVKAQVVYTWGTPHADDIGLLPKSLRTLKAVIVPMWEIELPEFGEVVLEIVKQGLWEEYEYENQSFYRIKNFTKYQILKRDRQPQILLQIELSSKPNESWKKLENMGFQLEDTDFQMETEEKRREGKRREVKRSEEATASVEYLKKIPEADLKELTQRFVVTEKQVKSKAEDLKLYCEKKGKTYKNYKSFLLNAIKNDYPERADDKSPKSKYKDL